MLKFCCFNIFGKKNNKYNKDLDLIREEPKNVMNASRIGGVLGLNFVSIPFLRAALGRKIGRTGTDLFLESFNILISLLVLF